MPAGGSNDTLGSSTDTWGNTLTPAMVNDYRFGVWYSYQSFGICTFMIFDCRLKVHYTVSTTGISSVAESKSLGIFPNPAASSITVSAEHFIITDQAGRTVLGSAASTADVSSLAPGLYFIRHNNSVAKFIKQ